MATNNLLKLTLLEQVGLEDLKGLLPISAFLCIPVLENYMDDSSQRFVPFLVFKDRKLSIIYNQLIEVLQDLQVQIRVFWGRFLVF